jgi:hypothetical protein
MPIRYDEVIVPGLTKGCEPIDGIGSKLGISPNGMDVAGKAVDDG